MAFMFAFAAALVNNSIHNTHNNYQLLVVASTNSIPTIQTDTKVVRVGNQLFAQQQQY